jgi:hypothetical protein
MADFKMFITILQCGENRRLQVREETKVLAVWLVWQWIEEAIWKVQQLYLFKGPVWLYVHSGLEIVMYVMLCHIPFGNKCFIICRKEWYFLKILEESRWCSVQWRLLWSETFLCDFQVLMRTWNVYRFCPTSDKSASKKDMKHTNTIYNAWCSKCTTLVFLILRENKYLVWHCHGGRQSILLYQSNSKWFMPKRVSRRY